MVTATTDDPIRAEVERVLHALVEATFTTPLRLAAAVPRCVRRRAERLVPLAEPWRVARSLLELVAAGGRGAPSSPASAPDDASSGPAVSPEPVDDTTEPILTDTRLPIEDYESLAASQVVDRLPTLTPAELEEVRAFEAAHRGRRTVLGRIEQLLA